MLFPMLVLPSVLAAACDQGDDSMLKSYERKLLRDFPDSTSALGVLCFDTVQGASDGHAQALWILGMKALSSEACAPRAAHCSHTLTALRHRVHQTSCTTTARWSSMS